MTNKTTAVMEKNEDYYLTYDEIAEFYRQYGGYLFRCAQQIVHNDEDAREVLHEGFIKMLRFPSARGFTERQRWNWMIMIIKHAALDRLRQNKARYNAYSLNSIGEMKLEEKEVGGNIDNVLASFDWSRDENHDGRLIEQERLRYIWEHLKPEHRQVLALLAQGFKPRHIMELLNLNDVKRVYDLARNARDCFSRWYERYDSPYVTDFDDVQ